MSTIENNWFQLAIRVKSSVIPAIMPRVILCTTLGILVSIFHIYGFLLPTEALSYLGLAEKRRKARTGGRRRQEKMNQVQGMGVK
ncbi:bestrophin family ion channel [Planktothrix pseudagardhii]|uniref:Uncharacterized protein n=1 Tax=Planktothrix pseudagardhii TaxID=132604 RepID=A0A9W4GAT5_9CYAN|nr:bestrophin family ion channel [Planktothrix pseudagardhii]CAD5979000.1 hypothetical protein NO713_04467 [Planktothrix pseudagardhii]